MARKKKQPEETPEQMTAHEYIDATLKPGEGRDEERAKQYKMIAICASLTSITCAIRLKKNDGDEEELKTPLRDNEIQIMNELAEHFKSLNAQPPYIDPNDGRSIKLLLMKMMEVAPFVMDELEQTKEELPLKGDIDLYAALALGFRDAADPIARPFIEAVEKAKQRQEEHLTDKSDEATRLFEHITPNSLSIVNTPVMNELAELFGKDRINAGPFDATVIPAKGKQEAITDYVIVESSEEVVRSLSEYERSVLDAYHTISMQASKQNVPPIFTEDDIYRLLPGGGERASEKQRKLIRDTLSILSNIKINTLDATDSAIRYKYIEPGEKFELLDVPLVDIRKVRITAKNGKATLAYLRRSTPPLLYHAEITRQMITTPLKYQTIRKLRGIKGIAKSNGTPVKTDIAEVIPMTPSRAAMTSYMIRRIAIMKNDTERAIDAFRKYIYRVNNGKQADEGKTLQDFRREGDKILFESILKAAGIDQTSGKEKESREVIRRHKDFCFDALDYWKAEGFIIDYSVEKKGKSAVALIINHTELPILYA